jgi:hypothetical protein
MRLTKCGGSSSRYAPHLMDMAPVCRVLSLWFQHPSHPRVNAVIETIIRDVSSHVFIPLSYQILSRLGMPGVSLTTFHRVLEMLVLKCCMDHPHHTIVQLLALQNSNGNHNHVHHTRQKHEMHNHPLTTTKVPPPPPPSSHMVPPRHPETRCGGGRSSKKADEAAKMLHLVKCHRDFKWKELVENMTLVCHAYVTLALYDTQESIRKGIYIYIYIYIYRTTRLHY